MTQSPIVDRMRGQIAVLQLILNRDFANGPLLAHDRGFFFDGAGGWKVDGWLAWRAACLVLCGDLSQIQDLKKLASELETLCDAQIGTFTLDAKLKADLGAIDQSLAHSKEHLLSAVEVESLHTPVAAELSLQDLLRQLEETNRRIAQLETEHARTRSDLDELKKALGG